MNRKPGTSNHAKVRRPDGILKACPAVLMVLACLAPAAPDARAGQYAGVLRDRMDYFASGQRNFHWCWAASIQMVLNYYGIDIVQEQIVARTHGTDRRGRIPDFSGTIGEIMANLNDRATDNRGRSYSVQADVGRGAPVPAALIQELSREKPVLIAYSGREGGHAAVLEGAFFESTSRGPVIHSLIVRDPWPGSRNVANRGRAEYRGWDLASRIQFYWYVTYVSAPGGPQPAFPAGLRSGPRPPAGISPGASVLTLGAGRTP